MTRARLNLDSPDRWAAWRAAWHVFLAHPLTGAGPGLRSLTWRSPSGVRIFGYAHNEYLQLLATLGLLGVALLLAGLVGLGLLLRRHRTGQRPASDPNPTTGTPTTAGTPLAGTPTTAGTPLADTPTGDSPTAGSPIAVPVAAAPVAAAAMSIALLVSMTTDFIGHFPSLVLTAAAVVGCAAPVRPARP